MNLLDILKRVVVDQTVKLPGGIRNWFGASGNASLGAIAIGDEGTWLVLDLPQVVGSLDEFWRSLPPTSPVPQRLSTVTGSITVPLGPPRSILIVGATTNQAALDVPIKVTGPVTGDVLTWYADGRAVNLAPGQTTSVALPVGTVTAAILVVGTGGQTLEFPATFPVQATVAAPSRPEWQSLRAAHLDPVTGASSVVLRWFTAPEAGTYAVFRRRFRQVATLAAVSTDSQQRVVASLSGLLGSVLAPGDMLFVGRLAVGRVISTADDPTGTVTVTLRPEGANAVDPSWVGAAVSTAPWIEVNRVQSLGQPVLEYSDGTLPNGEPAEYVLQAAHRLDASRWSELSSVRAVVGGDITPPGSITIRSTAVTDGVAVVNYTTPIDADYAGVRVYRRDRVNRTLTAAGASTLATTPALTTLDAGKTITLTSGAGLDATRTILSVSAGVATLDEPWAVAPSVGNTAYTQLLSIVINDAGRPASDDQLSFVPSGYGDYLFCTYDQVENEQSPTTGVVWTYDAAQDTSNGPSLDVRVTPSDTTYTIAYTSNTTVYTSTDGTTFVVADPSPIIVTRTDSDIVLSFRAERNGRITPAAITIPALGVEGDGAGTVDLTVRTIATLLDTVTLQVNAVTVGTVEVPTVTMTLFSCEVAGYTGVGPHTIAVPATLVVTRPVLTPGASVSIRASVASGAAESALVPIESRPIEGRGRELLQNPEFATSRPVTGYYLIDNQTIYGPISAVTPIATGPKATLQVVSSAAAVNSTGRVLRLTRTAV